MTHFPGRSASWDGDDSDVTSLLGPSDNLHYNVNSPKHRAATLGTQRAEAPWESGSFKPSLWGSPSLVLGGAPVRAPREPVLTSGAGHQGSCSVSRGHPKW